MHFTTQPYRRLPLVYWSGVLFLITQLLLSSEPVNAEWVAIVENNQAGLIAYVDPETIRHKGDLVKMWILYDFKTVQAGEFSSYLSSRAQMEADCAEEHFRMQALSNLSGNMGNGKVVYLDNIDHHDWKPVPPDTLVHQLWKVACGKK